MLGPALNFFDTSAGNIVEDGEVLSSDVLSTQRSDGLVVNIPACH